ncbi:MAG: nitroreductase family protein [Desulfamplus sp.]|nr:nitroreductase family protein [Desulfamplus sp.]MBF0390003.1 nitroreductase family protein [Desulfamplus sp.]
MSLSNLIKQNRSFRRFDQSFKVELDTLKNLVDLARCSASAANLQPLKYILSVDPVTNERIFSCLGWAAYLKDWDGPEDGERPSAYIVIMGDKSVTDNFRCDHGIAAQSIMLGASELGLGGCMIASIHQRNIRSCLNIAPNHEVLLGLAIGKPIEKVVIEPVPADGNIRYWRDSNKVHHVPKRSLDEIIVSTYA